MLNERIRKLRLARGMTLQQLGDFFGISAASVSSWEKGTNFPDGRKLQKLADVLGVSVNELVSPETPSNFEGSVIGNSVPFVEWSMLSLWPKFPISMKETAALLHQNRRADVFATRYIGNESLSFLSQLPLPGSIIFIDPNKELRPNSLSLILDTGKPQIVICLRSEKGTNRLQSIHSGHEVINKTTYIGGLVEWQISGIFN